MPPYRVWGSIEDGAIEFESLTNETLEGALNVIRKSFFVYESVCRGVDLLSEPGASEELEQLCLDAAKDGISVVAVDVDTGEVIGVAFNKMQVLKSPAEKSAFEICSENCKYKSSKALVDFMIDIDARIDMFKHYNTDCIFEIMFLATMPSNQKRRIGELLVSTSIEVAKELKKGNSVKTPVTINGDSTIKNLESVPSLVSAIMTSNYSQKIAAKCGFEKLFTISYKDFSFNGKTFSERIGDEHPNSCLVTKRLI
ncbi:arylalkylamine N-acetyltransferase 1 isoform X2 [Xylocopa sonorina]